MFINKIGCSQFQSKILSLDFKLVEDFALDLLDQKTHNSDLTFTEYRAYAFNQMQYRFIHFYCPFQTVLNCSIEQMDQAISFVD